MNRRTLIKRALVAGAGGLLLPTTALALPDPEPIRRFWPGWSALTDREWHGHTITIRLHDKNGLIEGSECETRAYLRQAEGAVHFDANDVTWHLLSATITGYEIEVPGGFLTIPGRMPGPVTVHNGNFTMKFGEEGAAKITFGR